jgi:hypothetical protein
VAGSNSDVSVRPRPQLSHCRMSHPLVLKRRTWFLAPPQAGHTRVAAPGVSAPGNPSSSDGVCKEFAFTSNTGLVVPSFA